LLFIGSLKRNILAGYWLFPAYFANWQAGSRSIGEPDHLGWYHCTSIISILGHRRSENTYQKIEQHTWRCPESTNHPGDMLVSHIFFACRQSFLQLCRNTIFSGRTHCNEVILGIELRPCIGHHIDYLHLLGFAIIATSKKGAALIRHDEAGHFDGFGRDLAFGGLICATKNGVRLQSLLDSLNSFSKTE
jgi:hypothetical protein